MVEHQAVAVLGDLQAAGQRVEPRFHSITAGLELLVVFAPAESG